MESLILTLRSPLAQLRRLTATHEAIEAFKLVGTVAGVAGALWVASRLSTSGMGYDLMVVSNVTWGYAAWRTRENKLLAMNAIWFAINIIGICRWWG